MPSYKAMRPYGASPSFNAAAALPESRNFDSKASAAAIETLCATEEATPAGHTFYVILALKAVVMTTKQMILKEIGKVPEPMLEEVLDFIKFLENKSLRKISETAALSEASLAKDWLKPEEDEAWQDL